MSSEKSQSDRFKEAAREAECDEDKALWEAKLRQIAKQKPKPE
jgi:hypothetical protein